MTVREKQKILFSTLLCMMLYVLYFIFSCYIVVENNLLLSIKDINRSNVLLKAIIDFLQFYLPVLFFFVFLRKVHQYAKPNMLSLILLLIYLCTGIYSIYKYEVSIRFFYAMFFYFGVGFMEEMIFRQYIYNGLLISTKHGVAAIISGGVWGAMHGILPVLTHDWSLGKNISACTNEVIGCILAGLLFIFIMKKTKSVWNCVLIHALLDFTGFISEFR